MAKAGHDLKLLVKAIRAGEIPPVRAALQDAPELVGRARLVVDAARFARSEVLGLLLRAGADPDARYRGYRPLHALIQEQPHGQAGVVSDERLRCLDLLLRAGADPRQLGAYPPANALLIAAFTGLSPFVDALLETGTPVDGFAEAALGRVAEITERLAGDPGFSIARDDGGLTALQCAAASRMGRDDGEIRTALHHIARMLLDAGADPNARTKAWSDEVDTTYFAASSHQRELFALLLERGADATEALSSVLWNAPIELAGLALEHGAAIDRAQSHGRPLLNDLVRWGQVRQVLWLLRQGASPNVPDERGWTALHQAASRANRRMLAAMLAAGGDRNRRNAKGRTPLDVARARGRDVAVEILSEQPATHAD